MKKIFMTALFAGAILAGTNAMAQKIKSSKVPAAVLASLSGKYPNAEKVTWEKEGGNFEANWGGRSGEDSSVQFAPDGTFIQEVRAIAVSQLPANVANYVKAHYERAKITEAGKVTDAEGKTSNEAEVKGKDMIFDGNGNFVKMETE